MIHKIILFTNTYTAKNEESPDGCPKGIMKMFTSRGSLL